jgi:hypothetical protein
VYDGKNTESQVSVYGWTPGRSIVIVHVLNTGSRRVLIVIRVLVLGLAETPYLKVYGLSAPGSQGSGCSTSQGIMVGTPGLILIQLEHRFSLCRSLAETPGLNVYGLSTGSDGDGWNT